MNFNRRTIRKEAVAGSFYPADLENIFDFISFVETSQSEVIERIMKSVEGKTVNGLIVPHAAWPYSGKTALLAFKILGNIKPRNIALLGPSHHFPVNRVLTDGHNMWSTPLGLIHTISDHFFESNDTYHAHEHALEVQAPFIKYVSGDSDILPLIVGNLSDALVLECARHLFDHHYFVVISTDLSHYHDLEIANEKDAQTINQILDLNAKNLEACGFNPLRVVIEYCKLAGTKPRLIDYTTSAAHNGDKNSVVGYASFWF
jgi:MEMO1 family protein